LNKRLTYFFLLPALTCVLISCGNSSTVKLPSLKETYSKNDKKPFGGFIAYREIAAMYRDNIARDKKQPFTKTWDNISDTGALYICLARALFVNELEVDAMMNYVEAGNDLFISAAYIDELLLKKIDCNEIFFGMPFEDIFDSMRRTFTTPVTAAAPGYAYYYQPYRNYFFNMNTSRTRIIGFNESGKPNAIVYFHGKGRLFLHCDPRAFSNYFLLKDDNYQYLQKMLAYTNDFPEHLYWDDYYNKLRGRRKVKTEDKDFSTLSEIMKHPPLAFAFWLAIILLSLYILFGSKRLQRIIQQRKANENTTVTFTETIGRLYLQKKDNKNIADKMITYFNEYIRNKYFLNTNLVNEDFIAALSGKSGVQRDKVESLYRAIVAVHSNAALNDYELLSLNEQIQNFYKKT